MSPVPTNVLVWSDWLNWRHVPFRKGVLKSLMVLHLSNQNNRVELDNGDEAIFDRLPEDGSGFSMLRQLQYKFYGNMTIDVSKLPQFRREIIQILREWKDELAPLVIKQRRITARDVELRESILDRLLKEDALVAKLEEVLRLVDESLEAGEAIECIGD